MFAFKKKYYLFIENTSEINLNRLNKRNKFIIIYRNIRSKECYSQLINFRKKCIAKHIGFFIANDAHLAIKLRADGLYISSFNKSLKYKFIKKNNFRIIGSAHNHREVNIKKLQGCDTFFISRLFKTEYKFKEGFMGLCKFNLFNYKNKNQFVPLGGINQSKISSMKLIKTNSFALLSLIKKKPTISSRLF